VEDHWYVLLPSIERCDHSRRYSFSHLGKVPIS